MRSFPLLLVLVLLTNVSMVLSNRKRSSSPTGRSRRLGSGFFNIDTSKLEKITQDTERNVFMSASETPKYELIDETNKKKKK
ncbi:hypothetical protein GQ42DRAFT_163659 [Ramicandelaber brevisporus]|nr:hypothetical protein GQ42DRAFT_163659 [Ramicandelaber brevisporus]